jgi:hypothetical protein
LPAIVIPFSEIGDGIDGRTTRHPGYEISLRIRKRIEVAFGCPGVKARMRTLVIILFRIPAERGTRFSFPTNRG